MLRSSLSRSSCSISANLGQPSHAAVCVDEEAVLHRKLKRLEGMREEVAAFAASAAGQGPGGFHGTAGEELSECLAYVLDEEARLIIEEKLNLSREGLRGSRFYFGSPLVCPRLD